MRELILLNDGWQFVKTADSADAAERTPGEAVKLPHTWNAADGQDGGNDYYRGTCWYTRKMKMEEVTGTKAPAQFKAQREVWLEFGGAAMTAAVYFNGKLLTRHEGGYSTFRVNLTAHLREENVLTVSVDNADNDNVYPQKADFTFYGGLYREVKAIVVPKAHFALDRAGSQGIKVTPVLEGDEAMVTVEAWVDGPAEKVRFFVGAPAAETDAAAEPPGKLTSTDGSNEPMEKAASAAEPPAQTDAAAEMSGQEAPVIDGRATAVFTIKKVRRWDGINDPFLYTATAQIVNSRDDGSNRNDADRNRQSNRNDADRNRQSSRDDGDELTVKFGCRTIRFDPEAGFFLNGRSYPLRGVSRHQDRLGVGSALTQAMHEEDLAIIQEMGANTIRLAHYQHDQYFYDLCDRAGLILWAEIPYITRHMPAGRANTLSQMEELVRQNYHHPSIVCWGLSNEISAAGGVTEDLLENHRLLNDLCHRLDATRPTTMAHVFMLETDSPLLAIPDIGSYNLYFGWYLGELSENDRFFDQYHQTYPERCIGFSEYGADANPDFQSAAPEKGDYSESYQCLYHEHMLAMIAARPYLWATHVWNMFDFAADGRDEGGKGGRNQKGLVTLDRKLKKDAFYLYKAHWSREGFVHLCGSRYVERAEAITEIKVYSNQPEVRLFVDGVLTAVQKGGAVFRFMVPISGEHRVKAAAGAWTAEITVRRVAEPNPAYRYGISAEMVNWFDREDFKEGCFSIRDTMADLQSNPQTGAILGAMMARSAAGQSDVAASVKDNPNLVRMMGTQTLESMLKRMGGDIGKEQIRALNAALQQIAK